MSVNLKKGQKISLKKAVTQLRAVMVGLGWDAAPRKGGLFGLRKREEIDCDASVILCGADGKLVSPEITESCVYFGNLRYMSDAIIHQGDNLTGAEEGDAEKIIVDLQRLPENIAKLVFVVNIYDADKRDQHFGMIKNAYIRLVNLDSGREICRYDLSENYQGMTGMIVGELSRSSNEWEFNALGQPVQKASRLQSLIRLYE